MFTVIKKFVICSAFVFACTSFAMQKDTKGSNMEKPRIVLQNTESKSNRNKKIIQNPADQLAVFLAIMTACSAIFVLLIAHPAGK